MLIARQVADQERDVSLQRTLGIMSYVPPFVCQKASNPTMMDVKIGHMAILIQVHEDFSACSTGKLRAAPSSCEGGKIRKGECCTSALLCISIYLSTVEVTLPETNIAPENMASQKENESSNFQSLIFRGYVLLVLGGVYPAIKRTNIRW